VNAKFSNASDSRNHQSIRLLLDEIRELPCLVLKHLDDAVLHASNTKRLGKPEIKLETKKALEALNHCTRHTGM
jgi:hypothetical protein